jgi:geranylgeranyl diphosphate synthase type II
MTLGNDFNRLKKLVDDHILDYLPEIDPKSGTLYEAMKYSLLAGGKRFRPVLCLAAYEMATAGKGDLVFALPYACAIEYIQTYSLIHDDLPAMDNDDYRRGKLTNHKVFGEDIAILAGDGLLSAAYEVMAKDMLLYLDEQDMLKRKVKACFEIAKGTGCRGMVAGQVADVENEGKNCSADMLHFIDDNKTAAFIKSSVMCGFYLGGADKIMKENGRTFGECLGVAFQICDDILDVVGDPKQRGKKTGGDAELGKSTYPAVYGLEESYRQAEELLSKARESMIIYGEDAVVLNDILSYVQGSIRRDD